MLADFFVIGAPRSGTTSVYEYLNAHPAVYMSTVKEPDFFARPELDTLHPVGEASAVSLDELAEADPALRTDLANYSALFAGARAEQLRGEASAVYLGHPTAAWHIRGFMPDAPLRGDLCAIRPSGRSRTTSTDAGCTPTTGGKAPPAPRI